MHMVSFSWAWFSW